MSLIDFAERGLLPDALIRHGIRQLCRQRLQDEGIADARSADARFNQLIAELKSSPIAIETQAANEQHYELPTEFFQLCLGKRLKYSSAFYPEGNESLDAAEEHMLQMYGERAELVDGQDILELGCGWGSLSLWLAEHYPRARVTAVSNAQAQRQHIEAIATGRGLTNLRIITADMNDFDIDARFDRVVSVEMFEHMRNWRALFQRLHGWLRPGGRFFMHIFCHRDQPYFFEDRGEDDWMSRHFFTGGIMPSDALPLRFQDHLRLLDQWRWSGRHYAKTSNAWLSNMDLRRATILPILADTYGQDQAQLWFQRWRLFFLAVAETFAYGGGQTWWVSHYLFERRRDVT
jgi:cyclopropane-fatty-acyl-phospholipid synthase